jgi:hypothetical protein
MFDQLLPLSIQTMTAKLLVHLVECIFKLREIEGDSKIRPILVNIMHSFVMKITSLSKIISKSIKIKQNEKNEINMEIKEKEVNEEEEASLDLYFKKDVNNAEEDMKKFKCKILINIDCRSIVNTLILGLKNVIFVFDNKNPNQKISEHKIFIKIFKNGLNCYSIQSKDFSLSNDNILFNEKENLDTFASLFISLPIPQFQEIFTQQLPFLYEKILISPNYINIPTHFCAHQSW